MNIAECQELVEYLDDERFEACLVPVLSDFIQMRVKQLCHSEKDGDKIRGEITAYNRFINLRRELSRTISELKARA